jgi:lysophospholipase L1-like esterase
MNLKLLYLIALFFLCSAFSLNRQEKITVWLIGDSTISIKEPKNYPETGWGMPFVNFFDSTVFINNCARNGRSSRTFIAEGLWKPVLANMKAGDYVLIQFGHNDEVKTKGSYSTEVQFMDNLRQYIRESKAKNAFPLLLTPVARRNFDLTGKLVDTHAVYSVLVRNVAAELHVPLIDLDKDSQALLLQFGPESSKYLFNHLAPGEHPNYPAGKEDNTHFNEFGARRMAELVLAGIRRLHLDLENRIVSK